MDAERQSQQSPAQTDSGAGMIILRTLVREELRDHLVVVTRWYGGKHLGGDRFRHVQTCVGAYLEAVR